MRDHKLCFDADKWKIVPKLRLLPLPILSTESKYNSLQYMMTSTVSDNDCSNNCKLSHTKT